MGVDGIMALHMGVYMQATFSTYCLLSPGLVHEAAFHLTLELLEEAGSQS